MAHVAGLLPGDSEAAQLLAPDEQVPTGTRHQKLGAIAVGLLVVAVILYATPLRHPRAFRPSGQMELAVLETAATNRVLARGQVHHLGQKDTDPEPGPWECVAYSGDQNNTWCKQRGNISGDEYRFFGARSPCGDCWCCKREIEKKKKKICATSGESCLKEQCCETPGFQCFEKTPYWATCRQWCTPGPDPTDGNSDPWSCKELGPRAEGAPPPIDYELQAAPWVATNCSGPGEDCTATMCCKESGMQCYTKASGWSMCKPSCTPGPDPTDWDKNPWDCNALGSRTPGAIPGSGDAAPWVATTCSGQGEDCHETQCCKEPGHQCYAKVPGYWAVCMPSCLHGPLLTDANPDIWDCTALGGRTPGLAQASPDVQIADWVATQCAKDGESCSSSMCCRNPTSQCFAKDDNWAVCMRACAPGVHEFDTDDKPWSCKGLGPRTPRPWGHPSLYCFSVAQIYSYEGDIIRGQIATDGGAGIFACEQFDIFSTDGGVFLGDGPLGPVSSQYFANADVGTSVDGTAANTRLFMNVWEAVRIVGRYKNTDWTVKADPDAVLIPDKLRQHVQPHTGNPAYIITCTNPGMEPMMFGAVEAISRSGMEKYFEGRDACLSLPVDGWGEDRWLSACLNQLGAPGQQDLAMVSDGVCHGVNCGSGAAAFHPFKNIGAWQGCYFEAMR